MFGKWIVAKQMKAKTVPRTAPRVLSVPITYSVGVCSWADTSAKKSERAKKLRMHRSSASDVSVLGLMKK